MQNPLLERLGILLLAALAAGLALSARRRDRRGRALARLAERLGGTYAPGDPGELWARLASHGTLSIGRQRTAAHVITLAGDSGPVRLFDFVTVVGAGPKTPRVVRKISAVACPLPRTVPRLALRRAASPDGVAGFVGVETLRTGDVAFDALYLVRSDSAPFARAVLSPAMTDWLRTRAGYDVELDRSTLVTTTGARWEPEQFESALTFSREFLTRLPKEAWGAA